MGASPQATQQPVIPLESIGLPDGGVPPQAMGQAAGLPQPMGQATVPAQSMGQAAGMPQSMGQAAVLPQSASQASQMPISTQPLDLSALGVPGSSNSGNPPARPVSPPASVRSGQVSIFPSFFLFFV